MSSAADYIEDLQTNGRLVFTTDDAVKALGGTGTGSPILTTPISTI